MTMKANITAPVTAVLDDAHIGHIHGAFGTILHGDVAPRTSWKHRLTTLLAILGPGLIVMAGDNDAGAFSTYGQAGQNYGTTLLWTMALLIPVLYVNQEMVLRLGAVTGVGHARLIFERFGKFWGAFSVIDLFLLNGLTIITEFIGIALALDYLGLDKTTGVIVSAALVMVAVSTGDFRRFERFAMVLVFASLLLLPIYFMVHPPLAQVARDLVVPQLPAGGKLSDVMLIIIGLVGTTVAPWQLFFQQSYVIDKRITPRFIKYERLDLWLGIALVDRRRRRDHRLHGGDLRGPERVRQFHRRGRHRRRHREICRQDRGRDVRHRADRRRADRRFGGLAVDGLCDRRRVFGAPFPAPQGHGGEGFLRRLFSADRDRRGDRADPRLPLGLLTVAVQVLAGVLLPSATVFLLLLCNDKPVLGPWVNTRWLNIFTGAVIAVLVLLSVILTVSVLFPDATNEQVILGILGGGGVVAVVAALVIMALSQNGGERSAGRGGRRARFRATPGACRRWISCRRRSCRSPPRPGWASCGSISSSPAEWFCSGSSCWRSGRGSSPTG